MKSESMINGRLKPAALKPALPAKQSKWIPGESLLGLMARGDIEFLGERGLRIKKDLPREAWREGFKGFMGWQKGLQFFIGDMLIYAELAYGDKYVWAVDECMREEHTLRNFVWVCSHVAPERRLPYPMTFSHHEIVAALTPEKQTEWLLKAQAEDWSTRDLREAVRTSGKTLGASPIVPAPGQFMWEDSVYEFMRLVNRKLAPVSADLDPDSKQKLKSTLMSVRNRLDEICASL